MPQSESIASATHSQIRAHIERNIDRISEEIPADRLRQTAAPMAMRVLRVGPGEKRPFHTLITLGLSDRPMPVPASEVDASRHIELMMTLPEEWKFDPQSQTKSEWNWPAKELLRLSQLPLEGKSWLGWGHTLAHGIELQPYAPNTALCAVILAPSLLVKQEFYELDTGGQRIVFLAAIPLYREEYELKQREGMEVLLARMIDRNVKDVVHPKRRNVARKRFGIF